MLEFKLECIPPKKTHQSSLRVFKPNGSDRHIIARDFKGIQTQNDILSLLAPFKPEKPLDGALKVKIAWVYPYKKTEAKKNRWKRLPCTTRPDVDNLVKQFFDCLTRKGFWLDDSQVCWLEFSKWYGEDFGIFVTIEEIKE